jgi:hypothetical protein
LKADAFTSSSVSLSPFTALQLGSSLMFGIETTTLRRSHSFTLGFNVPALGCCSSLTLDFNALSLGFNFKSSSSGTIYSIKQAYDSWILA